MGQLAAKPVCLHNDECVATILNSSILLEDDRDYVSYLTSNSQNTIAPKNGSKLKKIEFSRNLAVQALVATASIIVVSKKCVPSWMQVPLFLSAAGFSVISLGKGLTSAEPRRLVILKRLLKMGEDFQSLCKKCLRFIKEMEMAAMGYTLVSGRTPINRAQLTQQKMLQQCSQLRHQLLKSCLKVTTDHRDASQQILALSTEDVKQGCFLCQIPLEELGPCFNAETDFEDLIKATDGFCMDFLRDTVRFMHAQQSEFLKLFSISKAVLPTEMVDAQMDLANQLANCCEVEMGTLQVVYDMHQNVSSSLVQGRISEIPRQVKTNNSPAYQAIHSIQIHLRSALQVAIQSEESISADVEDMDNIKDFVLPQLQIHLDAANMCVAEAHKSIQADFNTDDAASTKNSDSPIHPSNTASGIDRITDLSLLNPEDDFDEDRVFEDIVENIKEENLTIPGEEDLMLSRKKRIQEASHLMKELHSILHVKTSAEEREIRKSKLFPSYIAKEVNQYDKPLKVEPSECTGDLGGDADSILPSDPSQSPHTPSKSHCHENLELGGEKSTPGLNFDNISHSEHQHETIRVGFGFPSMLAAQAASLARSQVRDDCVETLITGLAGQESSYSDADS